MYINIIIVMIIIIIIISIIIVIIVMIIIIIIIIYIYVQMFNVIIHLSKCSMSLSIYYPYIIKKENIIEKQ